MAKPALSNLKPSWRSRFLLGISVGRAIDGLWVGSVEKDSVLVGRIEEALGFIKHYDPRRYKRLLQHLRRIWVRLLPQEIARFEPSLAACEIDTRFVHEQRVDVIATVIIHEATHARLTRLGVNYNEGLREKIERICVQEELRFASKLPDGKDIVQWVKASLSNPSNLADSAFEERDFTGSIEILRYRGAPQWLIGALLLARNARKKASTFMREITKTR